MKNNTYLISMRVLNKLLNTYTLLYFFMLIVHNVFQKIACFCSKTSYFSVIVIFFHPIPPIRNPRKTVHAYEKFRVNFTRNQMISSKILLDQSLNLSSFKIPYKPRKLTQKPVNNQYVFALQELNKRKQPKLSYIVRYNTQFIA